MQLRSDPSGSIAREWVDGFALTVGSSGYLDLDLDYTKQAYLNDHLPPFQSTSELPEDMVTHHSRGRPRNGHDVARHPTTKI